MNITKENDALERMCGITQISFNTFIYTWKIENYITTKDHKHQKVEIVSPIIRINYLKDKFEFQLQLNYRKNSASVDNYETICLLSLISSTVNNVNLDISLSIAVSNGIDYKIEKSHFRVLNTNYNSRSLINKVLSSKIFHDRLVNGDLTINCKFSFFSSKTISHGKVKFTNAPVAKTQSNTSIEDTYQKLLDSAKFSDVILIVREKRFAAHKTILAFRSPVFSAMFEHEMLENKVNIVKIPDLEPEIMEEVLNYIYTKKVKNINVSVSKLIYAADKYQLDDLRLMCEDMYIEKLSLSNMEEILNIVVKYETCHKLRQAVLEYFSSNGKAITEWESFERIMMSLSPTFILEITKAMWSKF